MFRPPQVWLDLLKPTLKQIRRKYLVRIDDVRSKQHTSTIKTLLLPVRNQFRGEPFLLQASPFFLTPPGPKNTILRFVVKFFPPDHTQLMEELTR